jgi:hemolysin III
LLRRLDHAGIFLMIAGSYTPFTIHNLKGPWAWGMTIAIWSVAAAGVLMKLTMPKLDRRISLALYLAMGWLVVVALKPMIHSVAWAALILLLAGGVLYSTGVIFYVNKRLKFSRAIWHGHVVAAAATHWTAVLLGVVLTAR